MTFSEVATAVARRRLYEGRTVTNAPEATIDGILQQCVDNNVPCHLFTIRTEAQRTEKNLRTKTKTKENEPPADGLCVHVLPRQPFRSSAGFTSTSVRSLRKSGIGGTRTGWPRWPASEARVGITSRGSQQPMPPRIQGLSVTSPLVAIAANIGRDSRRKSPPICGSRIRLGITAC